MNAEEAYRNRVQTQLAVWETELEALKAEARQAQADTKPEFEDLVDLAYTACHQAEKKVRNVDQSSDKAAEVLKEGIDNAINDLEQAVKEARSKFKDNE